MERTNLSPNLIHNLDGDSSPGVKTPFFIIVLIVAVVAGLLVGSSLKGSKASSSSASVSKGTKIGIANKETFKDLAEGVLQEGGMEGEGSFHLERPGGKSQNVYLTSSTVDLSKYVGKKVKVWGETFEAQKAGWLMDVGLVEIL